MIKIIREDCQYFIEQMNKLLENENKGELHIVQEGGEDARKDINEIFSTWEKMKYMPVRFLIKVHISLIHMILRTK